MPPTPPPSPPLQIPQFILEDAIARGAGGRTRIVVTQPRRIAAIGVASRVAAERCEPLGAPGGAVGYQIRGEKRAHPGTALLFTTTGVLLRRLAQGGLGHTTHVIVDEVCTARGGCAPPYRSPAVQHASSAPLPQSASRARPSFFVCRCTSAASTRTSSSQSCGACCLRGPTCASSS